MQLSTFLKLAIIACASLGRWYAPLRPRPSSLTLRSQDTDEPNPLTYARTMAPSQSAAFVALYSSHAALNEAFASALATDPGLPGFRSAFARFAATQTYSNTPSFATPFAVDVKFLDEQDKFIDAQTFVTARKSVKADLKSLFLMQNELYAIMTSARPAPTPAGEGKAGVTATERGPATMVPRGEASPVLGGGR